ncbi:hypothetical protein Gpo141_00010543 [Globisporangium polare]
MTQPPQQTKYPVVLIHGVFGYGRMHPAWGYFPPYWPEQKLQQLNANHVIVQVGTASSDHDRACEMFYQLVGGTVDYGAEHAQHTTHARYGATYQRALHPNWSASNPIHLVGHSLGALTALEFYQLICADFFGVGSSHEWVRSITSIAGPLTGSTLTYMVGLHDTEMKRGSAAHVLYIVLGLWGKVYHNIPFLRGAYDLRMDQWINHSLSQLCATDGPVNKSMDSGFFAILPSRRVELNSQLKHMDKLHLMSIVTSPKTCYVPIREVSTGVALLLLLWGKFPRWWPSAVKTWRFRGLLGYLLALSLWRQVKRLDLAKLPSLYGLKWLMRRTAKALPQIFDGFDAHHWEHNDGAVNIHSQLRPWFPNPTELSNATAHMDPHTRTLPASLLTTALSNEQPPQPQAEPLGSVLPRCDSHISIHDFYLSEDRGESNETEQVQEANKRFVKGRWYVYRVNSNHFTGTHWDREAGNLYKSIFAQIRNEYDNDDDQESDETEAESSECEQNKSVPAFHLNALGESESSAEMEEEVMAELRSSPSAAAFA